MSEKKVVDPKKSEAAKKAASTRRANAQAANTRIKKNNRSFMSWLSWVLFGLVLIIVVLALWHPWSNPIAPIVEAPVVEARFADKPVVVPPTTSATALWTAATCSSISTLMGIPLEDKIEGNGFTYCVYDGPIIKINIPNFTIVDADRGTIEVWVNSDQTVQLEAGDMTFRQWNGKLDSACMQVKSLDEYLQTLDQNLHATAGNFDCPVQ